MKSVASVLFVLLVLAGPAFAQTVNVDYDKEFDYQSKPIKSFAWVDSTATVAQEAPLLHSRIVNGIQYYLTQAGITEVDKNADPDLYVTYHASTKEQVSFNTTSMGYGYPGGWVYGGYYGGYGMGGISTSTTQVSTYQVGTLVVDVWDAKSEKLVWRGTATNITVTENPQKMEKKIDKALRKMVDKWEKIKMRNAKDKAKAEKKAAAKE